MLIELVPDVSGEVVSRWVPYGNGRRQAVRTPDGVEHDIIKDVHMLCCKSCNNMRIRPITSQLLPGPDLCWWVMMFCPDCDKHSEGFYTHDSVREMRTSLSRPWATATDSFTLCMN